jgi:hypothetical protein
VTGHTAITITGTGFDNSATVVIGQGNRAGSGAIPATHVVVVSSTEITAVTGGGAMAGTWGVYVITAGGTSEGTVRVVFSYTPIPTVSSVTPHTGPVAGGTAITITGSNFVSGAAVAIGQGMGAKSGAIAATNVVVVSSTEITAVTGGGANAGTWGVFVINPDGGSTPNTYNFDDEFTYS